MEDENMNNDNKEQNGAQKEGIFKSKLIESLMKKYQKPKLTDEEIKEMPKEENAINISEILAEIDSLSDEDIVDIISDINSNKIKICINAEAIKVLNDKDADQEKIQALLSGINQTMDIDINSISELSNSQLESITERCTTGDNCKIGRVYVNSGYDKAAKEGYALEKYAQIRKNADAMIDTALGTDKDRLSDSEKFRLLYKYIVEHTKYDYGRASDECLDSRNLDNFFTKGRYVKDGELKGKGKAVCAGIAGGLKNLCDCLGIEAEYVQGDATRKDGTTVYHAWIRAKINGKWYNADPTWDLGKVGIKPYTYCMKSDAEFSKNHRVDASYNPTYTRISNNIVARSYKNARTYESADVSMEGAMDEYVTPQYEARYRMSRAANNIVHAINPGILDEELKKLNENKIPAEMESGISSIASVMNGRKLTLVQRIANMLYKGKHLKNIPFVKKFVEKNCTLKQEQDEKNPKATSTRGDGMYRTEGRLEEAIKKVSSRASVEVEKEDPSKQR